ncbi:MAG: hypothetical protein WCO13_14630 [Bacteroidota bacterium]
MCKIKILFLIVGVILFFNESFSQKINKKPREKITQNNSRVNAYEYLFFGMPEDSVFFLMNSSSETFKIGNYAYSIRCNYNKYRCLSSISFTQIIQLFTDSYDKELKEIHNDLLLELKNKYGNPTNKYGYPSIEKLYAYATKTMATNTWKLKDKTIEIGIEEYNFSYFVWLEIHPNKIK